MWGAKDIDEDHMFNNLLHYLRELKDVSGIETVEKLLHPGGYMHKVSGTPKYKAEVDTLGRKAPLLEVTLLLARSLTKFSK